MKSIGTQQLKTPVDVKVTPNSLVILDWSPNCIHFYSRNEDLLSSCVTQGKDGMVYEPWFFCLDTAGNIFITDKERDDVKILSLYRILLNGQQWTGNEECQTSFEEMRASLTNESVTLSHPA